MRGREVENLTRFDDGHRSLIFRNGLEDGRLIRNGRLYSLFSGLYQNENGAVVVTKNTMILMDMESLEYRSYPTGKREKNWMPFVRDGEILALTSTKPLNVVSLKDGSLIKEGRGLDTFWSGSSQFIPYKGGWLGVVHRHDGVMERKNSIWPLRTYVHAFLWMDQDFENLDLSPSFRFRSKGVEFCSGLDWDGDELILSYGIHDEEAHLLWMTTDGQN